MTSGSLSFDRAGDYYDRTRALPADAAAAVTDLLLDELSESRRVLEIGIGTGRIGLPLHQAGLEIYGIDISAPMLNQLQVKLGGDVLPAAVADATLLPFADQMFGAAFACHVLHLIRDWRRAVVELVRVVEPGGAVLVDPGNHEKGGVTDIIGRRFLDDIGGRRPGLQDPSELDDAFAAQGASLRELEPIEARQQITWGQTIDDLEAGLWSATWKATQKQRSDAAARLRPWVEDSFGALDKEREIRWAIRWRAYDLP